jgi:hypothetical protein
MEDVALLDAFHVGTPCRGAVPRIRKCPERVRVLCFMNSLCKTCSHKSDGGRVLGLWPYYLP